MKKTRNIHTPAGIFVITNVPFVLFAIVVVRPYAKETRSQLRSLSSAAKLQMMNFLGQTSL